jgi:hypothetical protein
MNDDAAVAPEASPNGILECLRMLADEAATLRLARTLLALLETVEICRIEAVGITGMPAGPEPSAPGSLFVH